MFKRFGLQQKPKTKHSETQKQKQYRFLETPKRSRIKNLHKSVVKCKSRADFAHVYEAQTIYKSMLGQMV